MLNKLRIKFLNPKLLPNLLKNYSNTATQLDVESLKNVSVDKNSLMQLRKKTGYTFINCKTALAKFDGDLVAAEAWLHDLAKKEGWEKATKLQSRSAAQGLIGVVTSEDGKLGAMVEVNCETDFVSRNDQFRNLVKGITQTALSIGEKCNDSALISSSEGSDVWDICLQNEDLLKSISDSNESIKDQITHSMTQLGEKLELKRATCLKTNAKGVSVFGYVHPRPRESVDSVFGILGQFGTLLGLKRISGEDNKDLLPLDLLGIQLCQHIVGMSPRTLGTMPNEDELEELHSGSDSDDGEGEANENQPVTDELEEKERQEREAAVTTLGDENELLRQDFLLFPEIKVWKHLKGQRAEILGYTRFQIGEN